MMATAMRFAVLGRRLRSSALLPVVVALLAYLLIGWGAGRPSGIAGDPSFFIKAGDAFVAPELLPTGSFVEENSPGHDGQFFFYIAQDPLLSGRRRAGIRSLRRTSTTSPTATSGSSSPRWGG